MVKTIPQQEENRLMIRDFPQDERPRERLIQSGAASLSNQELLAILLRTGTKSESVLQLSNRLLNHFDGLNLLKDASLEEITKTKGIGLAKAVQIMAAVEFGRRISNLAFDDRYSIRSPEDGANYVMNDMRFLAQEHFVCLYLNTKNQVLHKQTIFIGSLNASIVHPREVFKEAFRRSAASIICIHNHPSGDPTPSREDIEVTKRLVECGRIIGIDILDHLIIGEKKFISLKEKGYL
ncbi:MULTISPECIES: DNA repair protein RadC [Rossellomorea]|jgi:DNA repair protein RadC|uniref:JAB domain-containing protein n=1 Tax=Rossellomorea aquimaris TaxID=189382 RepID=A0A5D4ULF8_9BACI|nr:MULTISPECIES: DNA repair protein RadC [Rossellomorea]MDT9025341.1 DNA repair protein RadC [Rossellomorea sp. YC4-1]TYS77805.1 JAB domain-containing protein [Rossellomorea aquimaris]TYS86987.1 JAB domain-containing protein [Rossellomorea aquimaris]TYS87801.1 JAB domain-containing protein [Rossellomorea aquimaris]